jgi:flagellar hook-associated protein 1 FlgK
VLANGFQVALSSPAGLATALPAMPQLGASNTGTMSVASFGVASPGANTSQPVTLSFNGNGTFNVAGTGTGNASNVPFTAGQTISYNGWTMTLAGTPAAGDTLTVQATAAPQADNRNAQALLNTVDANVVNGTSFSTAYANLVGDVGTRSQSAQTAQTVSQQALTSATASRDQGSGVNLDEEAAKLLQYQQAYQAAAKVITTAQSLFQSILGISQ